ncbi:MAG: YbhB/YbcL family Raf kinase inhibitor-like protein [Rivularia sp. (in: Bacteria)]|nr:YbhB/YbcL family Raf kinase inhibitor-like protein [Rivularia sp. MS3]
MQLQSPAFLAGNTIPLKYTCDGDNASPPLNWENPPNGTSSYALIVEDPDSPKQTFTHWIVYDLPFTVKCLPEGVANKPTMPNGGKQGKNDFGKLGFFGPCPPEETHRYFFKLYALAHPLFLAPGASKEEVVKAMEGHVLESVELMGVYSKGD